MSFSALRAVTFWAAAALLLAAAPAGAQQMALLDTEQLKAVGWRGFMDWHFFLESLGALVLATLLGALIAFHPMTPRHADTLEEAELPKVYVMYALVGGIVGVLVLQFGMVVGFVVFGLGGLMRFRTDTASTRDTGRLIIVTLLGLICGLNLPHFAILSAVFSFVLIYIFDANPICRMSIKALPDGGIGQAAEAYRTGLAAAGCKVLGEKKSFSKHRVELVFRMPHNATREAIQMELSRVVPMELRGEVDWEVE